MKFQLDTWTWIFLDIYHMKIFLEISSFHIVLMY